MKVLVLLTVLCVLINTCKCQLFDKIRNFDSDQGYNPKNSEFNDYSYREYNNEKPVEEYYYNERPILKVSHNVRPAEQYYEEYSPHNSRNDRYSGKEEHFKKDYKEGANKKFGKLDQHSDKGYDKQGLVTKNKNHDQQNHGKQESKHNNYKTDDEYSHDRGHGFVKSWSWDRAHAKKGAAGELTKKLTENSNSNKGGHEAVAKHASHAHDQKGLKAIKGESGHKKVSQEEGAKKSTSSEKSD